MDQNAMHHYLPAMRSNTAECESRLKTSSVSLIAHFIGVSEVTRMESPTVAAGGKKWRVEVTFGSDRKSICCAVSNAENYPHPIPLRCRLSVLNQKGKSSLGFGPFKPPAATYTGSSIIRQDNIMCKEILKLNANQLSNPDLGFYVDDKIIVKVDLEFDQTSQTRVIPTLSEWSLAKEFRELLFQPTLSDVSIVVRAPMEASAANHVTIPAHSLMLSVGSPVFREMLHSGMQETSAKTIHLTDFDEGTVRDFLSFLYTGRCSMHDETLSRGFDQTQNLLQFAHKYDVRPLLAECEADLERKWLTTDTVFDVLRLAEAYNVVHLKRTALQFIADNARSLVSRAAFLDTLVKEGNVEVIRAVGGLINS